MSAVRVEVVLANYADLTLARHGLLAEDRVRRVTVTGIADPSVMRMLLPKNLVESLGLKRSGMPAVRNGEPREMVNDVFVRLLGRGSVFNAIVEPNRTDALLGAIVMEDLDLIVDCGKNELVPRDPTTITSEIE
jgi:hypothetical protein